MRMVGLCAILLVAITYASASDCGTSKDFKLNGSQAFTDVLKDPANLPIPGLLVEVLQAKTVVRQLRTDNEGRFDLGRMPAGNYRLRIVSQPFCAPRIECQGATCNVAGTLRINERKAKPVTVY